MRNALGRITISTAGRCVRVGRPIPSQAYGVAAGAPFDSTGPVCPLPVREDVGPAGVMWRGALDSACAVRVNELRTMAADAGRVDASEPAAGVRRGCDTVSEVERVKRGHPPRSRRGDSGRRRSQGPTRGPVSGRLGLGSRRDRARSCLGSSTGRRLGLVAEPDHSERRKCDGHRIGQVVPRHCLRGGHVDRRPTTAEPPRVSIEQFDPAT